MPVTVSARYFQEGIFAGAAPGELFQSSTCVECGTRFKTFESFRQHRREVVIHPCQSLEVQTDSRPDWALGRMPDADRDALAGLLAQLPDPSPIDTAQWLEETLTPALPTARVL